MYLITSYYISNKIERQKEIQKCLIKNNNNKYIEKIYLLNDKYYDMSFLIDDSKIVQIIISNEKNYKLNFKDCINFINKNLEDKICILSNSDIYFDESLSKIINLDNKLFALLRYDEDEFEKKNLFKLYDCARDDSQDSWIFKSPLKLDIEKINFNFGTLGCDNILANVIHEAGIEISNPCYDIIITHVHLSDIRTYSEDTRLKGIYCYVQACSLNDKSNLRFESII
jgi:hypothetical protein